MRIPKAAISGVSDSIHPSIPNFAATYAVQNIWPAMPAVEEIGDEQARALLAHHWQHGASDIHRTEQTPSTAASLPMPKNMLLSASADNRNGPARSRNRVVAR